MRITMTRRACRAACALLVAATCGTSHAAGDPEQGRVQAQACLGCHGVTGYQNAYPRYNVPKLGGQHGDYIVQALQGYRDGTREHPGMAGNAMSLTDEQMANIGAYFESLR